MLTKMFESVLEVWRTGRSLRLLMIWFVLVTCLQHVFSAFRYDSPPNCAWTHLQVPEDNKIALHCQVRTLTGELQYYNFTQFQVDHTWRLGVECSDVLFFESSLKHQSFTKLIELRELEIKFCKIRNVPGGALNNLNQLRRLSIKTHNSDWSAMVMELDSQSFIGLKELQYIDLSENNIFTLPEKLFCSLPNLISLNLTRNHLQNLNDLGFYNPRPYFIHKDRCFPPLQRLDLSNNDFRELPDHGLSQMKKLFELRLERNNINSVGDSSLHGLNSLRLLNMSSNQLVALPPEFFQSSLELREIYLQNNSLSVLAPGLFENLNQLLVLDLSANELTSSWVNKDTFKGLVRLVILNLARNSLTKLDAHTFKDLYSLQVLNLDHNQILSVSGESFVSLSNIHILSLTYNSLSEIDAFLFNGLYVLNQLFLDHNNISIIHEEAFRNCSNLQDLSMGGNQLSQVPTAITRLQLLQTLDLGENNLTDLPSGVLQGLPHLAGLRLVDNRLTELRRGSLSSLESLKVLNLAHNGLTHIENGALDECPQLRALRLDGNKLEEVGTALQSLPHLLWLNLSSNRLPAFDYAFVPRSLEWLDLHQNQISELGNYFELQEKLRIKMIDASFNLMTELNELSLPNSVENVFLSNNRIHTIQPNTFLKKTNLSRAVLYANELETLDLNALRLTPVPEMKKLPEFYIGGNPFFCDCRMEWLQRINQLSHLRQHPRVMDLDGIMCRLAHSKKSSYRPLLDTKVSQFLCSYDSHCFALCHCCDFDACDCEMTCPTNCTCYHDETWNSNIVDCSGLNYLEVPRRLPMDATELYLDGNKIWELGSHIFIGKKNLQVLYLNGSEVESINNRTFNGLKALKVLHLENNHLTALKGFEFDQLENLQELYLQDNRIVYIENGTFQTLQSLEILRLDGNLIVEFAVWQFSYNPYLTSVSLARNKWTCQCNFMSSFKLWLSENQRKVADFELIRCEVNNFTGITMYLGNVTTACDNYVATFVTQDIVSQSYVPVLVVTLIIFVVTFFLSVVVFVFRNDMKLWAHSQYGLRLWGRKNSTDETDKLFDAYVIYSLKDDEFVTQVMAAELENGHTAVRLCLHYRDFPVTSYLADTIVGAMESCRRVIIVLSKNFLECEWTNLEFRTAVHAALHQHKKYVVFVLLDDTRNFELDSDLQLYLKNCTTINWKEKRFWNKLRYSLPDICKTRQRYNNGLPPFPMDSTYFKPNNRNKHEPTIYNTANWHCPLSHLPPPDSSTVSTSTPSTQSSYVSGASTKKNSTKDYRPTCPNQYLQHTYTSIDAQDSSSENLYYSLDHQNPPLPPDCGFYKLGSRSSYDTPRVDTFTTPTSDNVHTYFV